MVKALILISVISSLGCHTGFSPGEVRRPPSLFLPSLPPSLPPSFSNYQYVLEEMIDPNKHYLLADMLHGIFS